MQQFSQAPVPLDIGNTKTDLTVVAESYSPPYNIGEYCSRDGKIYKCKSAVSSGATWSANNWDEVVIADEIHNGNIRKVDITFTNIDVQTEDELVGKTMCVDVAGYNFNEVNAICFEVSSPTKIDSITLTFDGNRVTAGATFYYGCPSTVTLSIYVTPIPGLSSSHTQSLHGTTGAAFYVLNQKVPKSGFYATEMPMSSSDATKVSSRIDNLNQAIANRTGVPQFIVNQTKAATITSLSALNTVLSEAGNYYIEMDSTIRTTLLNLGLLPIGLAGNLQIRKIANNYYFLRFQSYTGREWISSIYNGDLLAWVEFSYKSDIAKQSGTLTTTKGTFALSEISKSGNAVFLTFKMTLSANVAAWNEIINIPSGYRPSANINAFVAIKQASTTRIDQVQIITDGALRLGTAVSNGEELALTITYIM